VLSIIYDNLPFGSQELKAIDCSVQKKREQLAAIISFAGKKGATVVQTTKGKRKGLF
jgi:hypothetical protein